MDARGHALRARADCEKIWKSGVSALQVWLKARPPSFTFDLLPSNHDLSSSDMDLTPAGHRIPAEILADVVTRLRDDNDRMFLGGGMQFRETLRPLLACSFVCRHWAQICRPSMFNKIVIRGEAHLDHLLLLLSTLPHVNPSLADCIQEIEIDDSGKQQRSWIHRVPCIHPYIRSNANWGYISVRNMSYPSIYGHIPRTIPRSLLTFTRIIFTNVRFRRVHDLLRIVRDLPDMQYMECKRVVFDNEAVPDEDAVHIGREIHNKDTVTLDLEDYGGERIDIRCFFWTLCSAFSRRITHTDARPQLWRTFRQVFALFSVIEVDGHAGFQATPDKLCCWDVQLGLTLFPRELRVIYYEGNKAPGTFFLPPHNWDSLENLLLGLHPTPSLQLCFENDAFFKVTLDAVVDGEFLRRLHGVGQVDVRYYFRDLPMNEILALPAEYDIDGHHLILKASQRFELYELESEDERQEYLRGLVAAEQAASNPDGESGVSESNAAEGTVGVDGRGGEGGPE